MIIKLIKYFRKVLSIRTIRGGGISIPVFCQDRQERKTMLDIQKTSPHKTFAKVLIKSIGLTTFLYKKSPR